MQDQSATHRYSESRGHVRGSHSAKEKSSGWQPYQSQPYTPSKANDKIRPSIPYAQLIADAIESTPDGKITLNGIYNHVTANYPYFQNAGAGWKNSVRHNLSLNKNFVRVPRPITEKGKGAYWTFQQDCKAEQIIKSTSSRKQPKSIPEVVQTPQYYHSPRPSPAHFQMLYQNPNPEQLYDTGLFHGDDIVTSHDSYSTEIHDDFGQTTKSVNYLDQFERMLAMEQSRQSSQTSIETFHTYDDSIPETNIFYDQGPGYQFPEFQEHYQGYGQESIWSTDASFPDGV